MKHVCCHAVWPVPCDGGLDHRECSKSRIRGRYPRPSLPPSLSPLPVFSLWLKNELVHGDAACLDRNNSVDLVIPGNSSPFSHHHTMPRRSPPSHITLWPGDIPTPRECLSDLEQAPTKTMQLAGRPSSSSPPSPFPYTPSTCSIAYDRLPLPGTLPRLLWALSITRVYMHALPAASALARRS